ncbi:uncharacterized protein LOC110117904 [Ceratitis capitata]|uniref:uncharacterized protein LOC110117904 n=1 Tax=Ceratitis capitata TaxID=7213 RepID=UPI000A104283|nr:uncharacterized protein LOC110117904 [Ceratitis capitata]
MVCRIQQSNRQILSEIALNLNAFYGPNRTAAKWEEQLEEAAPRSGSQAKSRTLAHLRRLVFRRRVIRVRRTSSFRIWHGRSQWIGVRNLGSSWHSHNSRDSITTKRRGSIPD